MRRLIRVLEFLIVLLCGAAVVYLAASCREREQELAVKTYRKGGTQIRTYELPGSVDLNITAQRSRLREGAASVLLGLDNTRPGLFRSANPRKPLSVSSPDSADIVFAQGSDMSGRYTDVQADEFDTTDYVATANPATELVISAVGIGKGIIFNQDMVGGILILDNDGSELFRHKIASVDITNVANDTLTFDRASAVQFAVGNTFAILWEKEFDKRGVWMTDGQRIYLVQNDAVIKYLDIGTDTALGGQWHGSRISQGVFLFVNPKYAPRVITLDAVAANATENLTQLAGLSVPEAESDRIVHASTIAVTSGGSIGDPGIYRVRIRFADDRSGAVSRLIQVHATTVIGSDDFVEITTESGFKVVLALQAISYANLDNIPNVARATHIQIYRTIEDGISYFLERNLPISRDGNWIDNGTVDLKLSNAALINRLPLNPLEESGGGLPPVGSRVTSISGVTIIAGKSDDGSVNPVLLSNKAIDVVGVNHKHEIEWPAVEDDNTVYPSSLLGFRPESFDPSDKKRLSDIGDEFQNFGTAGNIAVAVMREGAYRLRIDGIGLIKTTIGERGIGTPWPESVVSVGQFVMWASPRGIIAYDTLFDRETGGYQYLVSTSGESLEKWLSDAHRLGDTVYCGYDARDDILRVRRVLGKVTPYSSVQVNDVLKWTVGDNINTALVLTDADSSGLEWAPAVDAALAEGDVFVVLPGAAPSATGEFTADGDQTSTTSVKTSVGTFTSGVGDFVIFVDGQNEDRVRLIATATSSKLTWLEPLPFVPLNGDRMITVPSSSALSTEVITFNELSSAFQLSGLSTADAEDPSSPTDVTTEMKDGDITVALTVAGSGGQAGKFTISGGLNIVKGSGSFTIAVNFASGNTLDVALMPYRTSTTVDKAKKIVASSGSGQLLFTLTSAFKDILFDQGGGSWSVRITWDDASANYGVNEVTEPTLFGRVKTAGIGFATSVDEETWSDSSIFSDDIVHFTSGVNSGLVRRIGNVSGGTSAIWGSNELLPTAPGAGDGITFYNGGVADKVDDYTISQTLWTLGVGGVTAPSGTPFAAISVGDVIVLVDESPALARVISAVTAGNQLAWSDALPQPSDTNDDWKILDKDSIIVTDIIEEEVMLLTTTSINIFVGIVTDLVLQYSFKLKTWVEFDNDPGINYVKSVFAGDTVLQTPALYSPNKYGSLFEVNNRDLVHPYDAYTVEEKLVATDYNISSSTIEIKSPSSSRQFSAQMLGDTVRILSSSTVRNGAIRVISKVEISATHKITFDSVVFGLDAADSFVIGGNHFKMRLAPYLGSDYSNVKTIHGLTVHATPTERHGGNTRWPDPPIGKLTLRAYRNLGDTAVDSVEDVFIFDEDDVARISEDRYSAVECQGNTIELEIESANSRTEFQIEHLSCDVAEDAVETEDASETA